MACYVVCPYSNISNEPIPSKSQLYSVSTSVAPPSTSVLQGFACASCMELGSTVNPAARTVATANIAAMKIALFIVNENTKLYVYLS